MVLINFLGYRPITIKVDTDFYTGKFVKIQHRTIEHIVPHSKGGKSIPENYAMTDTYINSKRGNMEMDEWLNLNPKYLDNMKKYVLKYWNLIINKKKHGEQVAKTVLEHYNIDLLS